MLHIPQTLVGGQGDEAVLGGGGIGSGLRIQHILIGEDMELEVIEGNGEGIVANLLGAAIPVKGGNGGVEDQLLGVGKGLHLMTLQEIRTRKLPIGKTCNIIGSPGLDLGQRVCHGQAGRHIAAHVFIKQPILFNVAALLIEHIVYKINILTVLTIVGIPAIVGVIPVGLGLGLKDIIGQRDPVLEKGVALDGLLVELHLIGHELVDTNILIVEDTFLIVGDLGGFPLCRQCRGHKAGKHGTCQQEGQQFLS